MPNDWMIRLDEALIAAEPENAWEASGPENMLLARVRDRLSRLHAVNGSPAGRGRLGPTYTDSYYGEFANCVMCGTNNILPCNYCRNCGVRIVEVPHEHS